MKKINKYLFGAFAALFTAGLFSCVEQAPEYIPGEADQAGCNGIYFPTQEAAADHTVDPTMERVITITISRDSLKGAGITDPLPEIEVPLVSSDTTGVFVVPDSVKFAAGQQEATFNVTFEKAKTAVKYPLNIAIEDTKYGSVYNNTSNYIDLSVFCVEWKYFLKEDGSDKALFSFVETMFDDRVAQFYLKYYEVDGVRHCVTVSEPSLDKDGNTVYGIWGTGAEYELKFVWYTKNNYFFIPGQYTGAKDEDGTEIYVSCEAGFYEWYRGADYYTSRGYANTLEWLIKNYPEEACYYDGHGGLVLYTYYICNQDGDLRGYGWSFGTDEIAIAESYVRVDYSIDVEAGETVDGVAPVAFSVGPDVTSVKYVIAEGELDAKEAGKLVTSITEAKAENVQTIVMESTDTIVGVSPAASGIYTVVAVSYADKDAKESAFTSFTYVAAEDKEEYAATFSIGVEPVSAMYTHLGYDGTNSIQYFMYGSDLTTAKIGIYKTATVEKNGVEAVVNAMKAVSDDVLKAINDKGYSTITSTLDPLTSYTLVAWGTNGYNSKAETVEFTTEGVPYYPTVEEVIGTYVYEGTSYFEDSDETDTLVIAASDNAELGNVMFTTIFGIPCENNVYATIDTENSTITIKNKQPFLHSDQYDGEIYFMINGVDEVSMTFVEEGHFNSPSAYFGYYIDGTAGQGWFNVFTSFDAKKVEEKGASVVAKRKSAFKTYYNETLSTKLAPVGKATGIILERNPQTVAFKAVAVERPARSSRFSAPVKVDSMLKF